MFALPLTQKTLNYFACWLGSVKEKANSYIMKSLLDTQISVILSVNVPDKTTKVIGPWILLQVMFNIPEPEIHDRIIIISVLLLREAEASSTAGNLLHFQIASPASPLETNCPFPVSDVPLDPQARGFPKRKQGSSPWLTCSQTSFIHPSPSVGRERGCASSPPAQARAAQELKALWVPRTGLAAARAGHRHGVGGAVPAHTGASPTPCWSGQHQVCCWTRPGAALTHYSQSPRSFTLSQPLAGLPERQSALHLPSQGCPGSWEKMGALCYTSVLAQRYKSFWLTYTSIGGHKQCLEGIESK